MYDESIGSYFFLYRKYFTVIETKGTEHKDIQFYITLTSSNFDFTKIQPTGADIRFSVDINGSRSLFYWISEMDYINKKCIIWIELPLLNKNESKLIYMFFGNTELIDVSAMTNLNFTFSYLFNYSPLNNAIFEGSISNAISAYGYYLGYVYTYPFSTKIDAFKSLKSWELFTNIYTGIVDYGHVPDSSYKIMGIYITGVENSIKFEFYSPTVIRDNIQTGSIVSYSNSYSGLQPESINLIRISYKESTDSVSYKIYNRKTYPDFSITKERSIEGNTNISSIQIEGPRGMSVVNYIKYIVIRSYLSDEIDIDLSTLYVGLLDMNSELIVDTGVYNNDMSSLNYYHESSCAISPEALSNDISGEYNSFWDSGSTSNNGYILIDFARNRYNILNPSLTHLDSGHARRCAAVRLSEEEDSNYPFWIAKKTTGWVAIDFASSPKVVMTLCLQGDGSSGMIKDFRLLGGYNDPRFNKTDWLPLFTGVCRRVTDWQIFYISNYNKYRYYKIEVVTTYGDVIKMKNWRMYECSDLSTRQGVKIDQVRLRPSVYESNYNYFPKQITVYGTNNYINWDTLLSITTTSPPHLQGIYDYWQRYDITTTKKYTTFKIVLDGNWDANDRFVIDEWELVNTFREADTYRILASTDLNIKAIWADKLTTFDSGWVYVATQGEINYIYDNYLARSTTVSGIIDVCKK